MDSAVYLQLNSSWMLQTWDKATKLIVDEISFLDYDQINKLNKWFSHVQNKVSKENKAHLPNMLDGYAIIFCRDFWQIPPAKAREN